jgi:hypothetical protein
MTELRRGAHPLRSLHGTGEGRRGAHGAAAREEAVVLPAHLGREEGEGGEDSAWWAGSACLAARGQKAGWAGGPLGRLGRELKKISFLIKIEFLNMPMLWKFAQGDSGGILT